MLKTNERSSDISHILESSTQTQFQVMSDAQGENNGDKIDETKIFPQKHAMAEAVRQAELEKERKKPSLKT